jgi:hypothetical protein
VDKPVDPCNDWEGKYYSKAERQKCGNNTENSTYALIDVGVFYNDVWAYRLCPKNGTSNRRYFDGACVNEGWLQWHPGAKEGGCSLRLGELVSKAKASNIFQSFPLRMPPELIRLNYIVHVSCYAFYRCPQYILSQISRQYVLFLFSPSHTATDDETYNSIEK